MDKLKKFLAALILCLGIGFVGSMFTAGQIDTWYVALQKPFFNPPDFVFAPVWTALYILMGIALFLIWEAKVKKNKKYALKMFFLQLVLNLAWSIIFFGFENPSLAFIEIIALWLAILATIKAFMPLSKNAAYLLVPYLAWVSFAAILNLCIVILN